jgi:predicted ATP-binding protein involved in virulence
MYLKSITLENFRSISKMEISFAAGEEGNRRWTVLLGENGCGKSSVIRAIGLVLAGSESLPYLMTKPSSWIRNGAESCKITAVLETADELERKVTLEIRRNDSHKTFYARNIKSLAKLDDALEHTDRNYFAAGYGVSRRPPSDEGRHSRKYQDSLPRRAQGLATLFSGDYSLVSLEQWAMDVDYRGGPSGKRPFVSALNSLLPGMTFNGIDKRNRQILFDTVDGVVPLSELSDGYQNMAAWCGDLLFRITESFPDRKDPLSTRGVLLIDELDLHLHPIWRRNLVEFLNKTLPNFQIIATTHSALTAQQCGEGELFVIRREGRLKKSPTLVPFVGDPKNMMLHQLLLSPMFGLTTLDSVLVQQRKEQLRLLARKPVSKRSDREKSTYQRLKAELESSPNWDIVPDFQKQQMALLSEVKAALPRQRSTSAPSEIKRIKGAISKLRGKK